MNVELFHISVPYCRYDDSITVVENNDTLELTYDLLGEIYDHLTLAFEKDGSITQSSEIVFYPILDIKVYNFYLQIKNVVPLQYKSFNGKDFIVGVSHDIDRTGDSYKYRLITYFFQTLKQKRPLLILKGIFGKNEETNFDYIIQKEKEFDASSTWFVLTRYGLKLNADYHLTDKEFQKAISLLKENEREIGIHIPYMDLTVENISNEFKKLENSSQMGMRMHHLRGKYEDLLKILNEAKIRYDSTFGFNECIAYRFGTSLPFHPIIEEKILDAIYEIPMNIMDLQITDAEKYKRELKGLFSILKEVKGVCIINWHNNRFNETKYGNIWRETFTTTLQEAKEQNGLLIDIESIIDFF